MPNANAQQVRACWQIMKTHGKHYAFATRFFSKEQRDATAVLYAFFRIPDEYVDNATSVEEATKQLTTWKQQWQNLNDDSHPVLLATRDLFDRYHIPLEYAEAFLEAMEQDLTKTRYATYAELEQYMYGSAAVVGLIMSHVIGFTEKAALTYAQALGEAMQLTNFLRDIGEDYDLRNRIYLPQEDLDRFGVTEQDITEKRFHDGFRQLMAFEIARARTLFATAEPGIALLEKRGQLPVRAASRLYEALLDELEKQQGNPFTETVSTTVWKKISLLPSALKAKTWSSSALDSVDSP